ncbi:MAG: type II secretion system protein [Methylophilaceae bacterium]
MRYSSRLSKGFTLVELLVVLAILMLLLTVAVPKYFGGVDRAKEAALKQDLAVMREALDKFYGDQGRYPSSLEELVDQKYLRAVPVDPITDSKDTWLIVTPPDETGGGVYDLHSGATGSALNGSAYADW